MSWQTLKQQAALLQSWSKSLAQQAEILLYGCEVAAGTAGQWFIQQLKRLTGAEIAASSTRIGSAKLGGDWSLDYQTGEIYTPPLVSVAAQAAYAHVLAVFVDETFRGTDVTSPNWLFGVGPAVPGAPAPQNPFLTARGTTAASPGGIPGGPTGALDAPGEGTLRLTNNIDDQSAFVLYDLATPLSQGLTISFELFAYNPGSTEPAGERADGVSFFLVDGATQFGATPSAGAFGGSLGYAQKNTSGAGFVPGIIGGFFGVGFDEFGNFASATDFPGGPIVRTGGNPAGRIPDSVSVRAGVTTDYAYVTDSGTLPFEIDDPTAVTRDPARRTVTIDITPTGLLSVRIDGNNDGDFNDPGETNPNLQGIRIADLNGTGTLPSTFKFGFASGTGDFNNIHEIRNLLITTPNDPPTAVSFSATLPTGKTSPLPGFAATDPNTPEDQIDSFTILTLPDPSQGILYVGDPARGGVPVTAGANLTPAQINNIFFQATLNFATTLSFTYTATDTRGSSAIPATVTLIPTGIQGQPCEKGLNETGNKGNNRLEGTPNIDTLRGLSGNDTLIGLGCPDVLMGGRGNDRLRGNAADDRVMGQQNNDTARGNDGNDLVDLGLGNDTGYGGKGNDTMEGRRGNDRMFGNGGNDTMRGGLGNDRMRGNGNDDILDGQQNRDNLGGGDGNDTINAGTGNDRATGDRGDDTVEGRRGNDQLTGGGGNDVIRGGRGNDTINGNTNDDILDGQQNDDTIRGGKGRDTINGGLGNDKLRGAQRRDRITARRGDDTAWGGGGRDVLLGQAGNDKLAGNTQSDRLNGGSGDDVITGGSGDDIIRPGSGADRIRYTSALQGFDRIIGFNVAQDQIDLRKVFSRGIYTSADPFGAYVRLGNGANGTIIRVDSNGEASGGFVRLAILEGVQAGSVSETNFLV